MPHGHAAALARRSMCHCIVVFGVLVGLAWSGGEDIRLLPFGGGAVFQARDSAESFWSPHMIREPKLLKRGSNYSKSATHRKAKSQDQIPALLALQFVSAPVHAAPSVEPKPSSFFHFPAAAATASESVRGPPAA